jgi:Protein of unknown function (DUF2800)
MNIDPRRGLMSASGTERAAQCSGSVALEKEVRQSGRFFELPDRARDSGIKIHGALAPEATGADMTQLGLDSEEFATAKHCAELRDLAIRAWEGDADTNGQAEIIIERRFWYRRGFFPLFSGQPDFVKIDSARRQAFIVNYKTGRVESEEAADNLQLRTEVVLLKHNFPELEEISGVIVEPWVTWDPVQVRYSGEDLARAENQIVAIAERTIWEADRRIAGPWCRKCNARIYCAEAINYAQGIRQLKPEQAIIELPRGEAGSQLWERIKVAKKLLEGLEWAYTRILEVEPDALPGYVLPERGKARRRVPYPKALKAALGEYLSEDEVDGCADYRLSKIQELIGLKHRIQDPKELAGLLKRLTQDVITITYDEPFIRPLTKKERETAAKIKEA